MTMYFRLKMPETARFTLLVKHDTKQTAKNMDSVIPNSNLSENLRENLESSETEFAAKLTTFQFFSQWRWELFGCASTWLLLDIAYYSSNLFQPDVFSKSGLIPAAYKMTGVDEVYYNARAQIIIALVSTIPGYWFTVFTIERMGRWWIQIMGFAMMTIFMLILAAGYNEIKNTSVGLFLFIYSLTFFFANWGPNATTFVVPAELFPTEYRSTAHGIAAASGKAGAIIGTFGFYYANLNLGTPSALGIMTAVNAVGFLCTFMVPETKNKTLEELASDHYDTTTNKYEAAEVGNVETEEQVELQRPSMVTDSLQQRTGSDTNLVKVQ